MQVVLHIILDRYSCHVFCVTDDSQTDSFCFVISLKVNMSQTICLSLYTSLCYTGKDMTILGIYCVDCTREKLAIIACVILAIHFKIS